MEFEFYTNTKSTASAIRASHKYVRDNPYSTRVTNAKRKVNLLL